MNERISTMKRRYLWIPLLLALTMLFCSCTTLFKREGASTEQTQAPVEPKTLLGMWYCADAYTVLVLKEDNVFDYYNLVTDDYAYASDVFSGQYTLADNKITVPLEEDFSLGLAYDAQKDILAVDGLEMSFSRVEILPTKLGKAEPEKFKGTWYNKTAQRVYDFREDGTVDIYLIQAGYYTYNTTETATYTVEGAFITIHFDYSENTFGLIYNPNKDSIANLVGELYGRVNELPTKHPVVLFPDYDKLDCSSVITLGNYKGLDLTTNATAYAAIYIFDSYYAANKDKTPKAITEDRAAAYGDRVVIDYTGYMDGKAFSGGSATNQTVSITNNSGYIPGFAEGIVGHKMGETFDVEVTFPENYGSTDLAGKKATFTMKLHTIYDLTISDEEVKTFSKNEFSTYAELLKEYVDTYRSQELWNILKEEATYENLPIEYYDYFYNYYRDYYHSYAFSMGMEYDAFLKAYYGITDADLMKESQTVALPYIIAQKIFKTENLAADKETYDAKYKELLDQYVKDAMEHFKYSEEDAKKFVEAEEGTNLNATVVRELVSEWLLTQNN